MVSRQPLFPQRQIQPVFVDGGVADFAGDADVAVVRVAVEDQARADARADLEEHQVADAAVRPHVTSDRAPRFASLSMNTGNWSASSGVPGCRCPPIRAGSPLAPRCRSGGRWGRGCRRRHPPRRALHSASPASSFQQGDGGLDAFLGLVAQGQEHRFLGDDVVAERGEDHPQVAPAEVDSHRHGTVAVEPDVQCAPSGTGGGLRGGQPGILHDFDDVGHRCRGQVPSAARAPPAWRGR
jgi:hypothetical protein